MPTDAEIAFHEERRRADNAAHELDGAPESEEIQAQRRALRESALRDHPALALVGQPAVYYLRTDDVRSETQGQPRSARVVRVHEDLSADLEVVLELPRDERVEPRGRQVPGVRRVTEFRPTHRPYSLTGEPGTWHGEGAAVAPQPVEEVRAWAENEELRED